MLSIAAFARALTGCVLMVCVGYSAAQQAYPNKPLRLISPYAAGDTNDTMARLIGPKLTESWGQPVIVDPRPGANTIIGSEALVKSQPDGYTIMTVNITHVLNALLLPNLPYDSIKDFAPVATIAGADILLVVHQSIPVHDLQGFISLAKSKPGQLTYATASDGGITRLAAELMSAMTGIKMRQIPYKGSAPAVADLVGGQVNLYFGTPASARSHINSGKLKGIAITGESRSLVIPQVPTFTEAGLPGFDISFWYGVLAPAGTPKEIVARLSSEIGRIVLMPDIKEKLANLGARPFVSSPEKFATLIDADLAKYGKVVKAANIKIEM